jgi:hypothetical protein
VWNTTNDICGVEFQASLRDAGEYFLGDCHPWDKSHGYHHRIATRFKDRARGWLTQGLHLGNRLPLRHQHAMVAERPMMVAGAFKPRIHVPDLFRRGVMVENRSPFASISIVATRFKSTRPTAAMSMVAERPMMVAGVFKPRIHVPDLFRRGATVENRSPFASISIVATRRRWSSFV